VPPPFPARLIMPPRLSHGARPTCRPVAAEGTYARLPLTRTQEKGYGAPVGERNGSGQDQSRFSNTFVNHLARCCYSHSFQRSAEKLVGSINPKTCRVKAREHHLLYALLLPRVKAGSRTIKITLYICLDLTQKLARQAQPPKKLIHPVTVPLPTGYPAAFRSREM